MITEILLKECRLLQAKRDLIVNLKITREKLLEAVKKDPVFKEIEMMEIEKSDLEFSIREQAVKIYSETGEKKIGQIGIRIMKDLIYDEPTAFAWAKEHGLCLNLDKRNFEKLAKTQDIIFVDIKERPTATIPTKIEVQE